MIIEKNAKNYKQFSAMDVGDCFYDNDGDLVMKVCINDNYNGFSFNDNCLYTYDIYDEFRICKCKIVEI